MAVVDKNVDRRGTRAAAEAYLKFLYTDEAQELIAKHFYRPFSTAVLKRHAKTFPDVKLFSITDIGTGWSDVHKQLVAEGGVFDKIYRPSR